MNREKVMRLDADHILPTYGRLPVVPDRAKGATMYDADGKKYIDFTSGIGVNTLGWCDEGWTTAVTAQLTRFQHISNYYYCDQAAGLAQKLTRAAGLEKLFFCNSGAEANEGAIKLARKYSYDKYGKGRSTIVTLRQSFHGRTVTTLAATGQDAFHNYFYPFTEGFKYVEAGNVALLYDALTDDVCAVLCEIIQGEGGVNVLPADYIRAIAEKCAEKDILFLIDEVQTGMGRTGKLFAYQHYEIIPDVVTLAKGLAGGLPIGAFLTGKKAVETLTSGMHGSTFGANPVSCAAGNYIMDTIHTDAFLHAVREKGAYICQSVTAWNLPKIKAVRGLGMMIGIQVTESPKQYLSAGVKNGLLILSAGTDVIRLLPPLNITYDEIEEGLSILKRLLENT